jgi:hypothetical protein
VGGIEADEWKQLGDACATGTSIAELVDDERLLDDLARPHARVERRVRILEHDLHFAARLAHPPPREAEHVVSPRKRTLPEVGSISRRTQRPVVVFRCRIPRRARTSRPRLSRS